MSLDDQLTALREEVDQLAHGPATIHDWRRADLHARTALLCAACCHAREQIETLMLLRLCIESRIVDLETGRD
jgi:hypothetical protein